MEQTSKSRSERISKREDSRQQVRSKRLMTLKKNTPYFVLLIIPIAYFVLFCYWPMFGISMAFQDYKVGSPFLGGNSAFVGFKWFRQLLTSPLFPRLLKNTLIISLTDLLLGFPICIAFALLLNEVRHEHLRHFTANVSMLPYFISTVVVVCMLLNFFSVDDGIFQNIMVKLGGERKTIIGNPDSFVSLFVGSGIWQGCGYGAVVYTAAIASIDPNLYEAAALDGSTRWKNIFHITIPCIMPTILIMLILRFGGLMGVNSAKILLMYRPSVYSTADVFGTYAYRAAFEDGNMSYSTAIDLFTSVVNLLLLVLANKVIKKASDSETSLF